jgi:hypothetical protein
MNDDVIQVYLLTRPSLAEQNAVVIERLAELEHAYPHQLTHIDVDKNLYLKRNLGSQVPRL